MDFKPTTSVRTWSNRNLKKMNFNKIKNDSEGDARYAVISHWQVRTVPQYSGTWVLRTLVLRQWFSRVHHVRVRVVTTEDSIRLSGLSRPVTAYWLFFTQLGVGHPTDALSLCPSSTLLSEISPSGAEAGSWECACQLSILSPVGRSSSQHGVIVDRSSPMTARGDVDSSTTTVGHGSKHP